MGPFSRREAMAGFAAGAVLAAGAAKAQTPPPRRLVGVPSQQFQFDVSIDNAIAMAKEAGFDAIEWNIRDGSHVPPASVARDLPRAVELSHKAGLKTIMATTAIQDASSPHAEDILKAMQAGRHPLLSQQQLFPLRLHQGCPGPVGALKPRVATHRRAQRQIWHHDLLSHPFAVGDHRSDRRQCLGPVVGAEGFRSQTGRLQL